MVTPFFECDPGAFSLLRSAWKCLSSKEHVRGKLKVQFVVLPLPFIKSREAIRVDRVWGHVSRVPDKAETVDVLTLREGACLETHHASSG